MRLFTAVVPSARALGELGVAVGRLREMPGADTLRWTGAEGWHYTLAFMGEVDERLLPELAERLGRAARRAEPFGLRIRGSGHFGNRALWVGADGGVDQMRLLAARATAAARRTGIPVEAHRRYTPHLTVARGRRDVSLLPFADALSDIESSPWQATELALVHSRLPAGGTAGERPRYETVGTWALGAGPVEQPR
ncbi:RNA 2',3'-cyclic phosphodiesterase [Streptomyces sp. NPDC051018]|uniref:RNA 2',3'-cyclic phosphodiesterase n=1 Tax=Streptomyces sp. NPDC051018 TaxID=3365639 RepID=UPI0037963F88